MKENMRILTAGIGLGWLLILVSGCAPTLYEAVQRGEYTRMEQLLAKGAEVDQKEDKSDTQETPLFFAARNGDLKAAQLLIANGADVNAVNYRRWTPLHIAVLNGHHDLVVLLLDSGANVNAQDERGRTALHIANFNNRPELVELILERGADTELTDQRGWTGQKKLDTRRMGARRGLWSLPVHFRSQNVPSAKYRTEGRGRGAAARKADDANEPEKRERKSLDQIGHPGSIPALSSYGLALLVGIFGVLLVRRSEIKD